MGKSCDNCCHTLKGSKEEVVIGKGNLQRQTENLDDLNGFNPRQLE